MIPYISTNVKDGKDVSSNIPLIGGIFDVKKVNDSDKPEDDSEDSGKNKKEEGTALIMWVAHNNLTKKAINTILSGKGQPKLKTLEYHYQKDVLSKVSFNTLTQVSKQQSTNVDASIVGYADVFASSNLILVPRELTINIEDEKEQESTLREFLIEEISDLIDQKYPIFLEKSWEKEFISQLLKTSLTELLLIGNTPYQKAYKFFVDPASVENMLVKAFGKQQFIEKLNRAPKIEALWKIIDIDAFNMKSWGPLIKYFGGPEDFMKMNAVEQEAIIHLYEIIGQGTMELYKYITEVDGFKQFHSLPLKNLAIDKVKSKFTVSSADLIKAIKTLSKSIPSNMSKLVIYSALFGSLKNEEFDLSKNCEDPIALIGAIQGGSYKIKPYAEGIALKAASLWLNATQFEDYQREYLSNLKNMSTAAKHYPTVKGELNKDYSWESIDLTDANAWFVGLETNCCQHLHSIGGACVRYAAANPDVSGIFRVMKKGHTIAQSWFWFDINKGNWVFDNIEVLGNEVRDSILNCYLQFIEEELAPRAELFGIKQVCVGLGYNDVKALTKYPAPKNKSTITDLGRGGSYSDAGSQVCLKTFKLKGQKNG